MFKLIGYSTIQTIRTIQLIALPITCNLVKLILSMSSTLGPAEEEKCKNDEAKEELMEETITSAPDSREDCTTEIPEEQDGISSNSKPKDAAVIPSEGNNSKPSKKVFLIGI